MFEFDPKRLSKLSGIEIQDPQAKESGGDSPLRESYYVNYEPENYDEKTKEEIEDESSEDSPHNLSGFSFYKPSEDKYIPRIFAPQEKQPFINKDILKSDITLTEIVFREFVREEIRTYLAEYQVPIGRLTRTPRASSGARRMRGAHKVLQSVYLEPTDAVDDDILSRIARDKGRAGSTSGRPEEFPGGTSTRPPGTMK